MKEKHTYRQTDKRTNENYKQTYRQTDKRTYENYKQTTDRQANTKKQKQKHRQTDKGEKGTSRLRKQVGRPRK